MPQLACFWNCFRASGDWSAGPTVGLQGLKGASVRIASNSIKQKSITGLYHAEHAAHCITVSDESKLHGRKLHACLMLLFL